MNPNLSLLVCGLFAMAHSELAAQTMKIGKPLTNAHAHNDYEHARPLLDALAQGFCSIEADVHLKEGELLVGHDPEDVQPGRSLEVLYLEPLRRLAQSNGGRIYPGGPSVILLIDFKTESEPTYAALKPVLERYRTILTRFTTDSIQTNAVTVILSGNRPRDSLRSEPVRYAAFDGRLADLGQGLPLSFMPLVSDNWNHHFTWKGQEEFPRAEVEKLQAIVARAHRENRKLRLWATPDVEAAWKVLVEAGVDLINTDKLEALGSFLRQQ